MKMLEEFKKFALRGNVVDMAIGIIIGGAFGTIVKSLVDDVLMPPLGLMTGDTDFSELHWTLKKAVMDGTEEVQPAVTINYGEFINNVIAFLIVALAVFILVKTMNAAQERFWNEQEKEPEKAPPPPEDIRLLREIRDALVKT